MFGVLKQLLLARQMKFDEGKIDLFQQRIIMNPAYTSALIQVELEKKKSAHIIYESMKELGIQWTKDLQVKYKMKYSDIVKWGINIVTLAGWGKVEIVKDDKENHVLIFKLRDSAIAKTISKKYGKTKGPVDYTFRGMIAGTFSVLHGVDMDCIEEKCVAMGHPVCEFVVKEKSKINFNDPKVKRQFEI